MKCKQPIREGHCASDPTWHHIPCLEEASQPITEEHYLELDDKAHYGFGSNQYVEGACLIFKDEEGAMLFYR